MSQFSAEQPTRGFKQQPRLKHDSTTGQNLLHNPNYAEHYIEDSFKIISKVSSLFRLGVLEFFHIRPLHKFFQAPETKH